MSKIIDKVQNALAEDDKKIVYSFEYFTPKPGHATVDSYVQTVSTMHSSYKPLFCDITWRPRDPYPALTLDLAGRMQNEIGIDTMMHLTCVGMPRQKVDYALETAKEKGVRNILALRGDFLPGMEGMVDGDGFKSGLDLVAYIRSKYGDYFGICVAGYPGVYIKYEKLFDICLDDFVVQETDLYMNDYVDLP